MNQQRNFKEKQMKWISYRKANVAVQAQKCVYDSQNLNDSQVSVFHIYVEIFFGIKYKRRNPYHTKGASKNKHGNQILVCFKEPGRRNFSQKARISTSFL